VVGVEAYEYEVMLPGWAEAHPDTVAGTHTREKSLGPAKPGDLVSFPDFDGWALVPSVVVWEIERVEPSRDADGRVILRRRS
jgi:hypothetical protein